jgi:cyclophilin family peptidyl-prolyl cis-trans isomerase
MKNLFLLIGLFLSIQMISQTEKPETLAVIHTSYGDITIKLYNDTPLHRDNFIKLINEGWYDDSPFHRVINRFMIQGGGNKDGRPDPGNKVDAEILPNHYHKKGALSAARLGDQVNPEKQSSGSQFYIVQGQVTPPSYLDRAAAQSGFKYTDEMKKTYGTLGGTPHLDGGYTVFGEVVMGLDVVDKIAAVKTGRGDVPVEAVSMTIEIVE